MSAWPANLSVRVRRVTLAVTQASWRTHWYLILNHSKGGFGPRKPFWWNFHSLDCDLLKIYRCLVFSVDWANISFIIFFINIFIILIIIFTPPLLLPWVWLFLTNKFPFPSPDLFWLAETDILVRNNCGPVLRCHRTGGIDGRVGQCYFVTLWQMADLGWHLPWHHTATVQHTN